MEQRVKQQLTTRNIKKRKLRDGHAPLSMLTCYDFQTAQMLDQTPLDMILVGDSVGNVILGYPTTVHVKLEEMILFGSAVQRGAHNTFVVVDLPFGSYASFEKGIEHAVRLFQETGAQALKLEGAYPSQLQLIERLTQNGIPIMGHIGLMPQSVNQQGGYYKHGKKAESQIRLLQEALALEKAGAFAVVLECVDAKLAKEITQELSIPTIGIGSGSFVDGQVLVLNDLLGMGPETPPSFCIPRSHLFHHNKQVIESYLGELGSLQ
jgi:3-methyl-2-oxobutanoate hydroxymethyltransferase